MPPAPVRRTLAMLSCLALTVPLAVAETPVRITDLRPDGESGVLNLDAAVFADKLYFVGMDDSVNRDLWVYDGVNPAAMVPGSAGIEPEQLTVWQGALYFEGGPFENRELWRYDGVNPPVEALDLLAGGSGNPTNLTAFGPELCFSATTGPEGDELACWDGATTPDVYELRAGGAGGSPEAMTAIGSTLYFAAFADGVGGEPFAYENFSPPSWSATCSRGLDPRLPNPSPSSVRRSFSAPRIAQARDASGAPTASPPRRRCPCCWTSKEASPPGTIGCSRSVAWTTRGRRWEEANNSMCCAPANSSGRPGTEAASSAQAASAITATRSISAPAAPSPRRICFATAAAAWSNG